MDDAIEQAARRLGAWATMPPISDDCWRIEPRFGRTGPWQVWRRVEALPTTVNNTQLDTPTAALFLLLLGMPEVAVTCPDCKARSATRGKLARWEWSRVWRRPDWRTQVNLVPNITTPGAVRPCPTCTADSEPLGRVQREPARLLLDAMDVWGVAAEDGGEVFGYDLKIRPMVKGDRFIVTHGDQVSRVALEVLADDLQRRGDQRGEWIALWLAGPEVFAQVAAEVEDALQRLAVRLALERVREVWSCRGARTVRYPSGSWSVVTFDGWEICGGWSTELEALDHAGSAEAVEIPATFQAGVSHG